MQDEMKGKWSQIKGKIREQWSAISNDDLEYIAGNKDKLLGKLQEIYGYTKEEAQTMWDDFYERTAQNLDHAKEEACGMLHNASGNVKDFVKHSPWKAIGIAALAGLVLGLRL